MLKSGRISLSSSSCNSQFVCLLVCLFYLFGLSGNSSKTTDLKCVKFYGLDGNHPGVIVRKFDEEQFVG